jgi:Leucine-rich repeat (LRR) protein
MIDQLPDELIVLIAVCVLDISSSRIPLVIGSAEEAMHGLGSTSRRMRRLAKAALAYRPDVWLRVSGCASAAECVFAFPDAPSLSVDAQVEARLLAIAMRSRGARSIRNLCVGGIISSARTGRELMVAIATTGVRTLDITISHAGSIHLVSTLERLKLLSSTIKTAACIARITSLRELVLASCHQLKDIRPIATLTSLTKLEVSHCSRVRDVSALAALSLLVELTVVSTSNRLAGLGALASLQGLRCFTVRRAAVPVRYIACLTNLETLKMQCVWPARPTLRPLAALEALRSLEFDGDRARGFMVRPIGMHTMHGLTALRLIRCDMPDGRDCITHLLALRELYLSEIHQMRTLPIHALTRLAVLGVHRCPALEDASALTGLVQLRELTATSCPRLLDLTHVAILTRLESMDIMCNEPDDIGSLVQLTRLRRLRMWVTGGIHGLDSLRLLSSLTDLHIGSFPHTTDIRPVRAMTSLVSVSLTGCNAELFASVGDRDAAVHAYRPATML